jgi:hypothetical protein
MSTRNCSRCGGTCHGCDNQDEPHICERCKELLKQKTEPPCEHAEKFRQELKALYVRNHGVTLDGELDFHCHVCSAIFTIPEDVMRGLKPQPGAKQTTLEVTKFRCVSSVNVPTGKGDRVLSELEVPGVLWTIRASDDVGEWHETYGSEIEKRAFIRGFEAATAMRGGPPVKVEEAEIP